MSIDEASQSHQAWMVVFRSALKGIGLNVLDVQKAADDRACKFGVWLASRETVALLHASDYARIEATHRAFHRLAGEIACACKDEGSKDSIDVLMAELDRTSRMLISFLKLAQNRAG